jgi:hypothetical protein
MADKFDISILSASSSWDKEWFSMMVPDEINKLTRLRGAILKWDELTTKEFDAYRERIERQPNPLWDAHGYDPVQDEAFMLMETARAMWASLAVSVSSTVERLFGRICNSLAIVLPPKANWGTKRNKLEAKLSIDFKTLLGYSEVTEARILANCFKHAGGTANDELVEDGDGPSGDDIEYESKDWVKIIGGTRSFMTALRLS